MSSTTENCAKSILDLTDFCYLSLFQLKILNFEACGRHLITQKTNSTKFAHYRLNKIRKDIEFFDFLFLDAASLLFWMDDTCFTLAFLSGLPQSETRISSIIVATTSFL